LDHAAVSRRHAQIAHDDGWVLTDLGSSNGTWIEGRKIDGPHRFSAATTVRLGMQHEGADITVEPVRDSVTTSTPPPDHPTTSLPTQPAQPDFSDSTNDRQDETSLFGTGMGPTEGVALRARLGAKSMTFPSVPGKKYTIGRDGNSDLTTDNEIVSRTHLELAWDGEHWTATDVSARGTFAVGPDTKPVRLPQGIAVPLTKSTTLRLGAAASDEALKLKFPNPILRYVRGKSRRN
jgi:pSer/pThr/pTyr-binding forkhead associated (FHA) protein